METLGNTALVFVCVCVCEQASLDFLPKQQNLVIIATHRLCVRGFHFHSSWQNIRSCPLSSDLQAGMLRALMHCVCVDNVS